MAATSDSGQGHGTNGSPQETIDEVIYPAQAEANENIGDSEKPPVYDPSPKHDEGGWGTRNPIKTREEGQRLLDTAISDRKQRYNVTDDGVIVKFQPDNTPNNGYHSYEVSKQRDIPPGILKQLLEASKITRAEYNKFRKGKK